MWRRSLNIFFSSYIFTVVPVRHWICVFYVEKIHQSSSLHSYNNYVYFAVENPRKLKEKPHKNWPRLEEVTTAIEKNPGKDPPAIVFFCSGSTLIQSGSILSC